MSDEAPRIEPAPGAAKADAPELSVVVPVYNERENLGPLCAAIREALAGSYEAILVDDGSDDGSDEAIARECAADARFRTVRFPENRGQAVALAEGFRRARAGVIAGLDADLQNDPRDIPMLVARLGDGLDVVCGRRVDRRDPYWTKVLPSLVFNAMLRMLFGLPVRDAGCTLRAYRAEAVRGLQLTRRDISFIPLLLHWTGRRVGEADVRHHPRRSGLAKYNHPARFFSTLARLVELWRERKRGAP